MPDALVKIPGADRFARGRRAGGRTSLRHCAGRTRDCNRCGVHRQRRGLSRAGDVQEQSRLCEARPHSSDESGSRGRHSVDHRQLRTGRRRPECRLDARYRAGGCRGTRHPSTDRRVVLRAEQECGQGGERRRQSASVGTARIFDRRRDRRMRSHRRGDGAGALRCCACGRAPTSSLGGRTTDTAVLGVFRTDERCAGGCVVARGEGRRVRRAVHRFSEPRRRGAVQHRRGWFRDRAA